MGTSDFVPRRDSGLVTWMVQFSNEIETLGTTVDVTPEGVTEIAGDVSRAQQLLQQQLASKAAQQAATATKRAAFREILARFRSVIRRIKAHRDYTPAIGERLGIVGPQVDPLLVFGETAKPRLRVGASIRNGEVTIRFGKYGFTGVQIACRRGSAAEFESLGKQFHSPFVDTRMNLANEPETRHYQAWYLDGDQLAGTASDILVVTVPE